MNNEFSLQELYDVVIKATCKIEIGGKVFESGETIASFDKINLANFNEVRKIVTANGGVGNEPHVWWETVRDVQLTFTQGVFNLTQLGLLTNAKVLSPSTTPIFIPIQEELSVDDEDCITTTHPACEPVFVYDKNGNKLEFVPSNNLGTKFKLDNPSTNMVVADYWYEYANNYSTLVVGQQLSNSYFSFIGKTRVKEDQSGIVRTALVSIPKLKLMSDLSMKLGNNATPVLGSMYALACPIGERGRKTVMDIFFLDEDIDTDM